MITHFKYWSALIALTSLFHPALGADFSPNTLSESKVSVMDLSKSGSTGKTYLAATIIAAPLPKLCSVLQNYPDYPNFMPNTAKAVVVKTEARASLVDMTLKLPMGKEKKYRLRMETKSGNKTCRLEWKLVPRTDLAPSETIADTTGYWLLTPLPSDENKTVVKYHVYSDPGSVPVGLGWIVDAMGKDSLPKTLESLRGKVKTN